MLKNKLKIMLVLVAIITLISGFCFATDIASEDPSEDVSLIATNSDTEETEPEWVESDIYKIGDKVVIDQIVDGNVFVMANEVVISSEIGGDVYVMAKKVTIDGGYIYSNLYVLAEEVTIAGVVSDAYVGAATFTLSSSGYVYRDLRISANSINIEGKVRRNVYAAGLSFKFAEDNGTLVGGNFEYSSQNEATIPDSVINGNVKFNETKVEEISVGEKVKSYIFDLISMLVYTLVVAILSIWLAPAFVERVASMGVAKSFIALGTGFATLVLGVLVSIILLISVIGSSVGVSTLFIFMLICLSGTAFASLFFGNLFAKLLKLDSKLYIVLMSVASALVIWLVTKVPVLGGFVGFLVAVFGMGTLVLNVLFKKSKKAEAVKE